MKKLLLICFALLFQTNVFCMDFVSYLELNASTETRNPAFCDLNLGFFNEGSGFTFDWLVSISNDQKWPTSFHADYYKDFAVEFEKGYLQYKNSTLEFSFGFKPHFDIVKSPYSLFISSVGNTSLIAEIKYEDDTFFFINRWIGLNLNSSYTFVGTDKTEKWADRGANIKTYGLKLGPMRIGFQDSCVYSTSYFNIMHFASPIPAFYLQYVTSAPDRPWTVNEDQNSIMGFFIDYTTDNLYWYCQFLVDDLNINQFVNPEADYFNPDKIAFSIGELVKTKYGTFGLYGAIATKHTFQSFGSGGVNRMYSYTYYEDNSIMSNGELIPISIEDNMIGYKNGENNVSVNFTWQDNFILPLGSLVAQADLEFSISGAKSPTNPWHETAEMEKFTKLIQDPILEKKLILSNKVTWCFIDNLNFVLNTRIGYIWNKLELYSVPGATWENAATLLKPSDTSVFVFGCALGVYYKVSF